MGPHRPLSQQSAVEPPHSLLAADVHGVRREQVAEDVIVVAGIQGDVVAPRFADGTNDIECPIAIERRDLHGPEIRNVRQLTPERVVQHAATDGRLEVEPEERHHVGDRAAVREQLRCARARKRPETQETDVVPVGERDLRLGRRLRGRAGEARHHHEGAWMPCAKRADRLRRELEYRPIEAMVRFTDGELRRVDADGEPSRARVDVVARQRTLVALVQRP